MIISALLNLIVGLLKLLFGWISLPDVPSSVVNVVDTIFGYMQQAKSLLALFLDVSLVQVLLTAMIAIFAFKYLWQFTWFIIRTIKLNNK